MKDVCGVMVVLLNKNTLFLYLKNNTDHNF